MDRSQRTARNPWLSHPALLELGIERHPESFHNEKSAKAIIDRILQRILERKQDSAPK